MPWPFFIPEFLKRRACRYLLHHYLGQYLEGKIRLEDLTIDLYNGTGSVGNIPLNVETINEALEEVSAPIQVVSGYIGQITVSIPWSSLMRSSCIVEVSGLTVTVTPSQSCYGGQVSMTDSLFFSMSTSRQLAEEVLKAPPATGEDEDLDEGSGFEGMEVLAKAIETVLLRVQITLLDTTVSVCHQSKNGSKENELSFKIDRIKFFDEMANTEVNEREDKDEELEDSVPLPKPTDFATKILCMSGLKMELGTRDMSDTVDSYTMHSDHNGVPIVSAGGEVNVKVKIKQCENIPGPKLDVDVVLGTLHLLLYPQQVHSLTELISGIISNVQQGVPSTQPHVPVNPGYNRPIPQQDMKTIEKQLVHHIDFERNKKKVEEEILQLDPWDISSRKRMSDSVQSNSSDLFYSFDLNTTDESSRGLEPPHPQSSRLTKGAFAKCRKNPDMANIQLGDGVGLQQLSPSSSPFSPIKGVHRSRNSFAHAPQTQTVISNEDVVCNYSFSLSGLTCAILESNPVHTYMYMNNPTGRSYDKQETKTGSNTDPDSLSSSPEYCSLDEGGLDPYKYFDCVENILKGRVGRREVQSCRDQLGKVLPADHLFLWLSTVRAEVTTEGSISDLNFTVASAEVWEWLYHNEANLPHISPVSVQPLVQFLEDSKHPEPCLRIKFSSRLSSSFDHSKAPLDSLPQSDLQVTLTQVQLYIDVTLFNRLHTLIHPYSLHHHSTLVKDQDVGQPLYYPSVNTGIHGLKKRLHSQVLFSHAMSSGDSSENMHRLSLTVNTNALNLSLRFPVADLSESIRPPWYRPPLRNEILNVDFSDLCFSSLSLLPLSSQRNVSSTTQFKTAKVYLSMDGTIENRELFLVVGDDDPQNVLGMPSIRFTYSRFEDSPLDQLEHQYAVDEDMNDDDLGEEFKIEVPVTKPSPFSQKRVMFSGPEKVNTSTESSEQLVLPATEEEMMQYESHITATSQYSFSLSLPSLTFHIPGKHFLETLYNRFATDLALWQPATPASVERANATSMFYSSVDILQPAVPRNDKFRLCKSVLREDSEEDDYTEQFPLYSPKSLSPDVVLSPTLLTLSLSVEKGAISMILPVKTEAVTTPLCPPTSPLTKEDQEVTTDSCLLDLSPRRSESLSSSHSCDTGILTLEFRGGHVCTAVNYEGENGRNQVCCKVEELNIKHCGSTQQAGLVNPSLLLSDHSYLNEHLTCILSPWIKECRVEGERGQWLNGEKEPMLTIALDSKVETDTYRQVNKLTMKLSDALFNFVPTSPEYNCVQQIGTMFALRNDIVPGYEAPTVITELHAHAQHSAVEYRPLYLSSQTVLTFDSMSISSTLVTGSPLLVTHLYLDQLSLFLSDRQHKNIQLRKDFVCVMEMGVFHFELRLCNKSGVTDEACQLFSSVPDIDVQCTGSELHFMMCIDSCSLLRDIILYLAENGDFKKRKKDAVLSVNENSSEHSSPLPPPPSTTMVTSTIGDLISEAIDDELEDNVERKEMLNMSLSSTSDITQSSLLYESKEGGKPMEGSKTQRVTTLIFSSDSEGEEFINNPSQSTQSTKRLEKLNVPMKENTEKTNKLTEEWELDEDDYCILSSPTTAKVGPGSEPVVKCLLKEGQTFTVIENYFSIKDEQVNQLKRPKHFPNPNTIYSLRELTIVWHLYGGKDFSLPSPLPSSSSYKQRKHKTTSGMSEVSEERKLSSQKDWKRKGGPGRNHDVLMEIELNKMRLQHETYPDGVEQSSRFVFLIYDIEIRDKLANSRINKFLYHYSTETRPRQSHANMFSVKLLFVRPEQPEEQSFSSQSLEAYVRMSMLPIRLNIDQDAIFFLYDFFQQLFPSQPPRSQDIVSTIDEPLHSSTSQNHTSSTIKQSSSSNQQSNVYIKSFVFYPDVPIRIDYEAKRFHSEKLSTLTGILLGLSHLDNSEVTLKAITYKHGILGWNQLSDHLVTDWMQDIRGYQLPRLLQGIGPIYHVTQLLQGAMDLFWLPIQQYQEDGRLVWGLQRGAGSFATSSGVAVVELSSRLLQSVESIAQTAFDMVKAGDRGQTTNQALELPPTHQPVDLREGLVNAYNVVSTGLGDTAWDLYEVAAMEHNEHGVASAVGGVLRNIPGTVVRPIIFASEATRHVLGGVKNQLIPEARKEARDKWKNDNN